MDLRDLKGLSGIALIRYGSQRVTLVLFRIIWTLLLGLKAYKEIQGLRLRLRQLQTHLPSLWGAPLRAQRERPPPSPILIAGLTSR